MPSRLILAAAIAAPLAACAPMNEPADSAARDVSAPKITATGPAQNCITVRRIDETRVWDDYTIDFEMVDGTRFRNTLPNRCYSLGFEESFAYDVDTGQLCNVDTIRVLYSDGSYGQSCGLGQFLPVELVERD